MSTIEETLAKLLEKMQEQQHKDSAAMQNILAKIVPSSASKNEAKFGGNPEYIIEALASNIREFCYDIDHNLTFDTWFARYEDLFEHDAGKLDDAAKTRLLLRKLKSQVHHKHVNYILPKHPRGKTFKYTVSLLKQLFGIQALQFNIRYNYLQLKKDPSVDFITYAGDVNKQCELFDLKNLSIVNLNA